MFLRPIPLPLLPKKHTQYATVLEAAQREAYLDSWRGFCCIEYSLAMIDRVRMPEERRADLTRQNLSDRDGGPFG